MTKVKAQFRWNDQDHVFTVGTKWWLDIGCGENRHEKFIGIDKRKLDYFDDFVCHDVENIPWPFINESCSVLLFNQSIEHIKPWLMIDLINECWRVLELEGLLVIITPYGTSRRAIQDPTHCNFWVQETIFYFVPGNHLYDVYKPKQWRVETLTFHEENNIGVAVRKINNLTPKEDKEIREKWNYIYEKAYKKENTIQVEKRKI